MNVANINNEDAWEAAIHNTFSSGETLIQSMTSLMSEMIGCPDIDELDDTVPTMYVITNQSKIRGGFAILDTKSIKKYFA